MLTSLYEAWSNNDWVSSSRQSYSYDNFGNLLSHISETWTNNAWLNDTQSNYTYDNNRNIITELWETWWNNAWVKTVKSTYNYDNNGNAIKGESFHWTENSWITTRSSLSLYYNYGANELYIYGSSADVTYTLIVTDIKDNELKADTYRLQQNYPNPFNPSTVIQYALPYESNVSITVYNTLGQVVKTFNEETKQTGSYNVNFNGEGLSSGIYLYSINAVSTDGEQNFQATKKMILIK